MLALFGGSFDPVHQGHLKTAEALIATLGFEALHFIPCGQHAFAKQFAVGDEHRIGMLRRAINALSIAKQCNVDLREVNASKVSYTIETCRSVRHEQGQDRAISLVVGSDVLGQFHQWESWAALLDYVHLLVIHRPEEGSEIPEALAADELLDQLLVRESANEGVSDFLRTYIAPFSRKQFGSNAKGSVSCIQLEDIAMSSTNVRASLAEFWRSHNENKTSAGMADNDWPETLRDSLSEPVRSYIYSHRLYR